MNGAYARVSNEQDQVELGREAQLFDVLDRRERQLYRGLVRVDLEQVDVEHGEVLEGVRRAQLYDARVRHVYRAEELVRFQLIGYDFFECFGKLAYVFEAVAVDVQAVEDVYVVVAVVRGEAVGVVEHGIVILRVGVHGVLVVVVLCLTIQLVVFGVGERVVRERAQTVDCEP